MLERNCSNCGREILAGRRFCGGCGQPVAEIIQPAHPQQTGQICANCGETIAESKRFCKKCGKPAGSAITTVPIESSAYEPMKSLSTNSASEESPRPEVHLVSTAVSPEVPSPVCSKCGAVKIPGKRFCKQCGQAFGEVADIATKDSSASEIKKAPTTSKVLPSNLDVAAIEIEQFTASDQSDHGAEPLVLSTQTQPARRFCSKCGSAASPGKSFCNQCGQSMATPVHADTAESQPFAPSQPAVNEPIISTSEPDGVTSLLAHAESVEAEIVPCPELQAESSTANSGELERAFPEVQNLAPVSKEPCQLPATIAMEEESVADMSPHVGVAVQEIDEPALRGQDQGDFQPGLLMSFDEPADARSRRALMAVGAIGAVVLVSTVWFISIHYRGKHQSIPIAVPATAQPQKTAADVEPKSKSVAQMAPEKSKVVDKSAPTQGRVDVRDTQSANILPKRDTSPRSIPLKRQVGNCTFDLNMVPRMLDQADRNRQQGNYADAARQYRSALDCDPKNARARSGLDLTLLDIRHQ